MSPNLWSTEFTSDDGASLGSRRDYDSDVIQRLSAPHFGLNKFNIIGFFTIVDIARAKKFYRDTLGLRLLSEEPPFALVFDANGIMLRLGMGKQLLPAHGTVLGWQVPDATTAVRDLQRPEFALNDTII